MTALSDARAALSALLAHRNELAIAVKAADDASAPIRAKAAANSKRRDARQIVVYAANSWLRTTMLALRIEGYNLKPLHDMTPKAIAESIRDGSAKISTGGSYGASYTAKGLAQRVVTPNKADIRAWDRAIAARKRIEAKLAEARLAEQSAAKAAFDNGTKVGIDALVDDIARAATLTIAIEKLPHLGQQRHELERLDSGDEWSDLAMATRHVDHLGKKVDDPECHTCKRQAAEAERIAERIAEITALPRRKFTCPTHGKVIGYAGTADREWIKDADGQDRQVRDCPILFCPKDWTRFINRGQLEADKAKADKAATRAKAKAPKAIRFVCPNPDCGEAVESEIDNGWVTCPVCEDDWQADAVKVVKVAA